MTCSSSMQACCKSTYFGWERWSQSAREQFQFCTCHHWEHLRTFLALLFCLIFLSNIFQPLEPLTAQLRPDYIFAAQITRKQKLLKLTSYKWKNMWKLCLRMEKFLIWLWYSKLMQQQSMTLRNRKTMLILKNHFGPILSPTLTPPILTGTKLIEVLQQDPVWDETKCAKCQILTAPLGFLFSDKLQILEQIFCHLQELMVSTGWSFCLEIPFI